MKTSKTIGITAVLGTICAASLLFAPGAFARGGNIEDPGGPDHHVQGPAISATIEATYFAGATADDPDRIFIELAGTCKDAAVTIAGEVNAVDLVDDAAQFAAATRDELTGVKLGNVPAECGFPETADGIVVISARKVMHSSDADGNPVLTAEVIVLATIPKK